MPLIDNYQRGWALRYIREAKAELVAAQKTPQMTSTLLLEAVKKAQAAVYYSLGDPASVEAIVRHIILTRQAVEDPILKCLVEIERTVQQVAQAPESDKEKAVKQVDEMVKIASDIVELFTGAKAD